MKALLLVLASLFIISSAEAQIKQWVDENGVTYFEANGTATRPAPESIERKRLPGEATAAIDRSHAGLTLGDVDSMARNIHRWVQLGQDRYGLAAFISYEQFLPTGVTQLAVTSTDVRISSIHVTYEESSLGGWDLAIRTMTAKYGEPRLTDDAATWLEGRTGLRLIKNGRGGILAVITDREAVQRHSARAGHDTPKF